MQFKAVIDFACGTSLSTAAKCNKYKVVDDSSIMVSDTEGIRVESCHHMQERAIIGDKLMNTYIFILLVHLEFTRSLIVNIPLPAFGTIPSCHNCSHNRELQVPKLSQKRHYPHICELTIPVLCNNQRESLSR